ncbi:MAG: hypothetical protein WGN25_12115 [Candidatus Electrothrix sp. GW3-4]|uniref:hypothetical protein n=1 Tax=Candidatus Electrothrix sp. GW3-4 TaxID=3126740 RepID=UPI0030D62EE0
MQAESGWSTGSTIPQRRGSVTSCALAGGADEGVRGDFFLSGKVVVSTLGQVLDERE